MAILKPEPIIKRKEEIISESEIVLVTALCLPNTISKALDISPNVALFLGCDPVLRCQVPFQLDLR